MVFNTGAALLDAIVLAVVSNDAEGTYGYKITQDVRQAIEISESTLYPILRRLEAAGCLTVYTVEHSGRLRKFYRITAAGIGQIDQFLVSWPEIQRVYQLIKECAGDDARAVSE